jgi:hypothetical protein
MRYSNVREAILSFVADNPGRVKDNIVSAGRVRGAERIKLPGGELAEATTIEEEFDSLVKEGEILAVYCTDVLSEYHSYFDGEEYALYFLKGTKISLNKESNP